MTLDLIAILVLTLVIVILSVSNVRLFIKNRKLSLINVQQALDKSIIADRLKKEIEKSSKAELEKSEGFLKFISESRDWAFQYIEDVQAELLAFKEAIEPKLEYANKYIRIAGSTPAMTTIDEISVAYEKLKRVMPEEDKK